MLERYTKNELKQIVDLYNLSIDAATIKKKKSELIKSMNMIKKTYNHQDIEKKLNQNKEPKKKIRLKIVTSKEKLKRYPKLKIIKSAK